MSTPITESGLERELGVRRLAASIVNTTIGAGIFVIPALVTSGLGHGAPYAYFLCAGAMALIVTCFAAAGSRVSVTGGLYAYVELSFGPYIGFLSGALYWVASTIAVASVAAAFIDSIAVVLPLMAIPVIRGVVLAFVFAVLALVNIRGVKPGAQLIEVITLAKLVPLGVLIVAGLWLLPLDTLTQIERPPLADLGRTAITLIFAFVGIEVALVPSGEVRDPSRTVPRAIYVALAVTTIIYLIVQAVAQATLGSDIALFQAAPLAETGARLLGSWARVFVLAGATISMFGYVAGDMLGTPRVLFAFARDGMLPSTVAAIHPRCHTPWIAIVCHAVLAAALAISSTFGQLAVIANVATLSVYLLAVGAAFQLARRNVTTGGEPFVPPGGVLVHVLAALVIVWLLSNATAREFIVEAIVLTLASILYLFRRLDARDT